MKRYFILCILLMGLSLVFPLEKKKMDIKNLDLNTKNREIKSMGSETPDIDFGNIPLYFIANKGQVNDQAKFYAKASRYTLWLTKEGLVFDSTRPAEEGKQRSKERRNHRRRLTDIRRQEKRKVDRDVSRLIFLEAARNPEIVPVEEAKLRVNYFIGNDKSRWHCDVPTSKAVLYKNLYENIDLKVYGLEKQIEYDWIVKAGGNPEDIIFRYKNVKGTRIDKEGNLLIETDFGELIHKKPVSYQEIGKERKDIDVAFKRIAENTYGFEVGAYDRSRQLIIDPVVLAYSTYLGGGDGDYGRGITVDGNGNAYVTGYTYSTDFPTLDQYQGVQGFSDVFVTRLDTNQGGTASLLYSTYLGGGENDEGYDIAVDSSGNAYVTGKTNSTDFPTLNQYQSYQGYYDVFVTRLDTTQSGASSLLYSTYLGGGSDDFGHGIAVDGNGNAYVTGETYSTDFPTLNQYQADQGGRDAFVIRLDTTRSGASSLLYSTYLGGGDGDYGRGIALDSSDNAHITGYTDSMDFPTLNQYQLYQNNRNVFVTTLDSTQSGVSCLLYSTYLGGGGNDYGYDIAVEGTGNVFVTGHTSSTDFPTLNQYQVDQGDGNYDVFVTRLDPTQNGASSLLYSTYLGGGGEDYGYDIAVDVSGNAYVTGYTNSTDFPTLNPYQGFQGVWDVFITSLDTARNGTSSLLYSTYLGGWGGDEGWSIAVDTNGNAYVTGVIDNTDFPTFYQYQGYQGGTDGFVSRLSYSVPGPEINIRQETIDIPNQGSFDFGSTVQGFPVEKVFTIENTGTTDLTLDDLPIQISGTDAGQFTIDAQPSTPVPSQDSTTFTIRFNPTSGGSKTASILIVNNDSDENPYDITLNGTSEDNPGWEPVGGMEYNMIVQGTAYDQSSLASEGDWIGAFGPGGENDCRAVTQVEAGGSYYLTVQGDIVSGEQINFKFWSLPAGPELDCMENLVFLADHVYQDQVLHFGFSSLTLDLISGWNWISSNVLPPDTSFDSIFSEITDNILQVKSQKQSAIRTGGYWIGDLPDMSDISLGYMYKIKTSAPCSLTITGNRIPPDNPIPFDSLWTWVAYLPTSNLAVADAIDSIFPVLEQVKSQTQSVLKVGADLTGDMPAMQEGLGYMIKTTAAGILQYPDTQMMTEIATIENDSGCSLPWTPITGNQYTMIALGNVFLAGESIDSAGYYVAGFGPGGTADCRSLSEVKRDGSYFATIRGNTNDQIIHFKLYERVTGNFFEMEETLSYLPDGLKKSFDLHAIPPVISGRVTYNSTGLAGVTLTFGSIGNVTTGTKGNYSFQVEYDWTGRVTPKMEGYTFSPDFLDYSNITSNQTGQNYSAQVTKTFAVTSPNGGEKWKVGSSHPITWSTTRRVRILNIEYSINNGTSWKTIESAGVNDGSPIWIVPDKVSDNCLVRISTSRKKGGPSDVSDAVFSIIPASSSDHTFTATERGKGLNEDTTFDSGDKPGS